MWIVSAGRGHGAEPQGGASTSARRPAELPLTPTLIDRTPPLWRGSVTHVEPGRIQVDGTCARLPVDVMTEAGIYRVMIPLGSEPCPGGASSRFVALPVNVKSLATSSAATLALLGDGGWASISWLDGGVGQGAFTSGDIGTLRSGVSSIYGLGSSNVARWTPTGVESVTITGTVIDAVEYFSFSAQQLQLAAVTSEGLRVGTIDGGLPIVAPACRGWARIGTNSSKLEVVEASGNNIFTVRELVAPGSFGATTPPQCMAGLSMPPFFERASAI